MLSVDAKRRATAPHILTQCVRSVALSKTLALAPASPAASAERAVITANAPASVTQPTASSSKARHWGRR
eukprot:scaffold18271_cov71-Phaeocystis_antarctica.AAC.5